MVLYAQSIAKVISGRLKKRIKSQNTCTRSPVDLFSLQVEEWRQQRPGPGKHDFLRGPVLSLGSGDNKPGSQSRHFLQSCPRFRERRHQTWPTNTSLHAVLSSLQGTETTNLAHKHITYCSPVLSSRNGDIKPGPQTRHFMQSCPCFKKQRHQTWLTNTSHPAVLSLLL